MVVPMKGQTKNDFARRQYDFLSYYQRACELISSALHNNALCKVVCKCPCLRTVIPPPFFRGMVKTLDVHITVMYGRLVCVGSTHRVTRPTNTRR